MWKSSMVASHLIICARNNLLTLLKIRVSKIKTLCVEHPGYFFSSEIVKGDPLCQKHLSFTVFLNQSHDQCPAVVVA